MLEIRATGPNPTVRYESPISQERNQALAGPGEHVRKAVSCFDALYLLP
jgi:hypothetical protein